MADRVSVLVLDRAAIAAMGLPGGQIYRWGARLGREVKEEAQALLVLHGAGPGPLWESVASSSVPVAPMPGVQVNVRAGTDHALFYIKGTRPHIETTVGRRTTVYRSGPHKGRTDWGFMKFFWLRGGFTRWEQTVFHPGWRGYNFLDEAKDHVLLARGI